MTPEKYKKMPYKDTDKTPEDSKADIMRLLFLNGVKKSQWTTTEESDILAFMLNVRMDNQDYELAFRFEPAMLYREMGRGGSKKWVLQKKQSWRMFYWLLKAKLEAVQFGLEDAYEVMAANIVNALPDGRQITIGEAIQSMMASGTLDNLALEYKPPPPEEEEAPRRKVVSHQK